MKKDARQFRGPLWAGWLIVVPLLLLVWEIAANLLEQPWILPSFHAVLGILLHPLQDHYSTGSLLDHTLVSVVRVLIGFSLAAVAGVTLGLLMGGLRTLRCLLEPLIELLRPLCPIAWMPFAIAVFKLRTVSELFGGGRHTGSILDNVQLGMVFVLFWGAFFPIVLNTLDGVGGVRRNYIALARVLGAGRRQLFAHVYLPAALPMILTGLRQGVGICWFVIIAAEMLPGAGNGIGYLLMYAADQSDMAVVVAAMLVIATVGALFNAVMLTGMRVFVQWHGKEF